MICGQSIALRSFTKPILLCEEKRDCFLYSPFYMWLPNLDSNQE